RAAPVAAGQHRGSHRLYRGAHGTGSIGQCGFPRISGCRTDVFRMALRRSNAMLLSHNARMPSAASPYEEIDRHLACDARVRPPSIGGATAHSIATCQDLQNEVIEIIGMSRFKIECAYPLGRRRDIRLVWNSFRRSYEDHQAKAYDLRHRHGECGVSHD